MSRKQSDKWVNFIDAPEFNQSPEMRNAVQQELKKYLADFSEWTLILHDVPGGGDCLFHSFRLVWRIATQQIHGREQDFNVKFLRRYATNHILQRYRTARLSGLVVDEKELQYAHQLEGIVIEGLGQLVQDLTIMKSDWESTSPASAGAINRFFNNASAQQDESKVIEDLSDLSSKLKTRHQFYSSDVGTVIQPVSEQHLFSLVYPYLLGKIKRGQPKQTRSQEEVDLFSRAIAQYAFSAGRHCSVFAVDILIEALAELFNVRIVVIFFYGNTPAIREFGVGSCYIYLYNPGNHYQVLGCRRSAREDPRVLFSKPLHNDKIQHWAGGPEGNGSKGASSMTDEEKADALYRQQHINPMVAMFAGFDQFMNSLESLTPQPLSSTQIPESKSDE